jgi:hypothetical protein
MNIRITPDSIRNLAPLSDEQLRTVAPAIFSKKAAPDVSDRYSFVSTAEILPVLRDHGFQPVAAAQRGSRNFGVHRVELFHENHLKGLTSGKLEEAPRWILNNSHDRTTRLNMIGGFFKFACSNGMIVSAGTTASLRMLHISLDEAAVRTAISGMSQMLDETMGRVADFRERKLNKIEQNLLANYAAEVRYAGWASIPVEAKDLLAVRREADRGDDLWTVFNRVQENSTRGGVATRNGRTTRPLKSFYADVTVNRRLWAGAEALFEGGASGIQALRKEIAKN